MNHFSGADKVALLIHENPFLLPVINRFGIRLGFKDKTVSQICSELAINESFFLAIVNTYNNKDYFPEENLMSYTPKLIVDYLRKTHEYYFNYLFPEVERRLDSMFNGCEGACDHLVLIRRFYNTYKEELTKHIQIEEKKVFPYVLELTRAWEQNDKVSDKFKGFMIRSFEKEHENVDQKIFDLKNIIIKYLDPKYNDNDCNAFLFAIFQFERDLLDHARIEDNILLNKVKQIEKLMHHG